MSRGKYFVTVLLVVVFAGCSSPKKKELEKYSEFKMVMATYASIDACVDQRQKESIEKVYEKVWELTEDVAWRMNVYDEKSDVIKINRSFPDPVRVDPSTYEVLKDALRYTQLTRGAFDITVYPLISLWRKHSKAGTLPTTEEILQTKKAVGADHIRLLPDQLVQLTDVNTRLDLGGIAAGYAIDGIAAIFRKNGVNDFYIDIGGDIYAGGHNCKGNLWRVGIRDPRDKSKLVDVVEITDSAISTSGNYEKFIMINNEKWSHIVNPLTGYPQKEIVSATLIAPTAIDCDAIATAVCVLGSRKGTELIDSLGGRYASLSLIEDESKGLLRVESKEYRNFRLSK